MKESGFCRFYRDLYWGKSVKKHTLVKWKLYHGKSQLTIFCVLRAMNDNDQLDIINSEFLRQHYFKENPAYIYGIAGSHSEALDLIVKISDEAMENGFEGRLVDYLESISVNKKN